MDDKQGLKLKQSILDKTLVASAEHGHIGCCLLVIDRVSAPVVINEALKFARQNNHDELLNILSSRL